MVKPGINPTFFIGKTILCGMYIIVFSLLKRLYIIILCIVCHVVPKSASTEANRLLIILTCRRRLAQILPEIKETVDE